MENTPPVTRLPEGDVADNLKLVASAAREKSDMLKEVKLADTFVSDVEENLKKEKSTLDEKLTEGEDEYETATDRLLQASREHGRLKREDDNLRGREEFLKDNSLSAIERLKIKVGEDSKKKEAELREEANEEKRKIDQKLSEDISATYPEESRNLARRLAADAREHRRKAILGEEILADENMSAKLEAFGRKSTIEEDINDAADRFNVEAGELTSISQERKEKRDVLKAQAEVDKKAVDDELNKKFAALRAEDDKKLGELDTDRTKVETELSEIETKRQEIRQPLEKSEEELSVASKEFDALYSSRSELKAQADVMSAAIEDLNTRAADLASKIGEVGTSLEQLAPQLENVSQGIDRLEKELAEDVEAMELNATETLLRETEAAARIRIERISTLDEDKNNTERYLEEEAVKTGYFIRNEDNVVIEKPALGLRACVDKDRTRIKEKIADRLQVLDENHAEAVTTEWKKYHERTNAAIRQMNETSGYMSNMVEVTRSRFEAMRATVEQTKNLLNVKTVEEAQASAPGFLKRIFGSFWPPKK